MTVADLAFLIGPVGAVLLVPIAVSVMLTNRHQRDWTAAFLLSVCPILGASWLGHWVLWVKLLEYMNTYEPVPPVVEVGADVCLAVCAVTVSALVVAMVIAVDGSRHDRSTALSE